VKPVWDESLVGPGLVVDDADWRGLERVGLDLSLMDLNGLNLARARLDALVAMGTLFDRCNLDDAVLRGARICDWSGDLIPPGDDSLGYSPKLSYDATLDPGDFHVQDDDDWHRWHRVAAIHACTMRRADLSRATLRDLHVFGTSLDGAILRDSDLYGAHLEYVTLIGADLSGADLCGAHLEDVDLTGATLPAASSMERCTFDRVKGI
jgi:uncharacterized protein YjbI with pentapeptide repeats